MNKINSAETRGFRVYIFENSNGEVLYVGKSVRPLNNRIKEHNAEELMNEVARIFYIELPNESQMIQYEDYYINLYKPRYNILNKGEGIPVPLPEYHWILYKEFYEKINFSAYNLKILEEMFNILNTELFNGTICGYPTYTNKTFNDISTITIDSHTKFCYNGVDKYAIYIPEKDVINNSDKVPLIMLSQMIQIWGEQNNVKVASNRNVYKNKRFAAKAEEIGLITRHKKDNGEREKYSYVPIGLTEKTKELIRNFGFDEADVFIKENKKLKSSSTRKYIDQKTGESVRATKDHFLICFDECPEIGEQVEKLFNKTRMVVEY